MGLVAVLVLRIGTILTLVMRPTLKTMKISCQLIAVSAIVWMLAACGVGSSAQPEGRYVLNLQESLRSSPQQAETLLKGIHQMGGMTLVFGKDGTFTTESPLILKGNWSIESAAVKMAPENSDVGVTMLVTGRFDPTTPTPPFTLHCRNQCNRLAFHPPDSLERPVVFVLDKSP
jgi:hypothetical protein